MISKRLTIVKSKIDRTKAQIDDLQREIANGFNENGYTIVSDLNFDGTEQIWRCVVRDETVAALSVRAGEIGHNLRTSLDNLACAVADRHCGRTNRTYFPFGKDVDVFETEVLRKTKDLPTDAVTLIRSLEPYSGGNNLLWGIHDMNREDKHPGLEAVAAMNLGMEMYTVKVFSGKLLIMGPRYGQHLVVDGYSPKFSVLAAQNKGEFLTTTPGTEFEIHASFPFHIAFSDLAGFEHEPVVAVLSQMRDLVESIVLTFEARFFS